MCRILHTGLVPVGEDSEDTVDSRKQQVSSFRTLATIDNLASTCRRHILRSIFTSGAEVISLQDTDSACEVLFYAMM